MLDQSLNEICVTVTMSNEAVVLHLLNNFALISSADSSGCHSIRTVYCKLLDFFKLSSCTCWLKNWKWKFPNLFIQCWQTKKLKRMQWLNTRNVKKWRQWFVLLPAQVSPSFNKDAVVYGYGWHTGDKLAYLVTYTEANYNYFYRSNDMK